MNRSSVRVRVSALYFPKIAIAVIAQLVERWLPKPKVAGPSPVYRSKSHLEQIMKKLLILIVLLLLGLEAPAQEGLDKVLSAKGYYTRVYQDRSLNKKAAKWLKRGEWRNGYHGADPDPSVNATEFYLQYQKNPEQWKALFQWLAKTDLLALPKGRHPIEGSSLVASVEDDVNGPLEKRGSESHYHHIDFQYVVKGVERFGILDHLTSKPNCSYRPDAIHYDYDVKRTKFLDSDPKHFFIFFPGDWHIAKVNSPKTNDQHIRVVVVKVDYKD